MFLRRATAALLALAMTGTLAHAMLIGPGKFAGVVFFDRWGGCILYSGVYLLYVSQSVKDQLRPDTGKCVQLDATDVYQPMNPGDGLIRKFTLLGPAANDADYARTTDLKLSVQRASKDGQPPAFTLRIDNAGNAPATLYLDELAPTLLAKKGTKYSGPADGPSQAVITRSAFCVGENVPMHGGNETWSWNVTAPQKLQRTMPLPPHGQLQITLSFTLPEGEYQFLAGYGGGVFRGACLASNALSFNIDPHGNATAVNTPAP